MESRMKLSLNGQMARQRAGLGRGAPTIQQKASSIINEAIQKLDNEPKQVKKSFNQIQNIDQLQKEQQTVKEVEIKQENNQTLQQKSQEKNKQKDQDQKKKDLIARKKIKKQNNQ